MKILTTLSVSEEQQKHIRSLRSDVQLIEVKDFFQGDEDAEILLSFGQDITEETLLRFPDLRWIQVMSAGIDHLPLKTMAQRGIALTNARGVHQIQMSEHIMWSMLTLMRQGQSYVRQQVRKVWDPTVHLEELYGKTICIIGAGSIGEATAEKCRAFGMTVWGISKSGKKQQGYDRIGTMNELADFLPNSDIVVAIVPLTLETQGMFNRQLYSLMKDGSYFINVARGPVVNEIDLAEALDSGKIRAAALDVFVQEPLPEESPFWSMENVLLTPHIAGRSPHYTSRVMSIFLNNMKLYPDYSKMLNHIDLSKGY